MNASPIATTLAAMLLAAAANAQDAAPAPEPAADAPALVVAISVDQLSSDLFEGVTRDEQPFAMETIDIAPPLAAILGLPVETVRSTGAASTSMPAQEAPASD